MKITNWKDNSRKDYSLHSQSASHFQIYLTIKRDAKSKMGHWNIQKFGTLLGEIWWAHSTSLIHFCGVPKIIHLTKYSRMSLKDLHRIPCVFRIFGGWIGDSLKSLDHNPLSIPSKIRSSTYTINKNYSKTTKSWVASKEICYFTSWRDVGILSSIFQTHQFNYWYIHTVSKLNLLANSIYFECRSLFAFYFNFPIFEHSSHFERPWALRFEFTHKSLEL